MERFVLVRDFWRVHTPSFQQAITCMRKSSTRRLNIDTEGVIFLLTYRHDNGGNPALMYKYETFVVVRIEEMFNTFRGLREVWDAGAATREKEAQNLRKTAKPGQPYIKHFPVGLCVDTELDRWVSVPLFVMPPYKEEDVDPDEKWIRFLKDVTNRGLIFESHPETKEIIMGKMFKIGKEWRWRECPPGPVPPEPSADTSPPRST